jgi:predicted TIM-barrel fold metal-dependent hydrolase
MLGIYTGAILTGIPVNDKLYRLLFEVCDEAGVPVKLSVGMTAMGQGKPGGGGVHLTELKREINGRLQDRFMFGSDHPWFSYERLLRDWETEGYKSEVLEKVYVTNAQRILGLKA